MCDNRAEFYSTHIDSQENIDKCLACEALHCTGYCKKMKTRSKKKIDDEMALKLYRECKTDREIAERLGVHETSIQKWRVKNGIDRRRKGENRRER